ncbi:MAG: hypothetical protein ABI824_15210 [Acidobacteriota bacterium]
MPRKSVVKTQTPVDNLDEHEKQLVRGGILQLPSKPFNVEEFLAIGKDLPYEPISKKAIRDAIDWAKADMDISSLRFGPRKKAATKRSER